MAECAARLASLVRAASSLSGRPHLRRPPPRESLLFLLEQEDVPGGGAESPAPNRAIKDGIGNVGITILPALDMSITRSATIHGSEGYAITKAAARRGVTGAAWRFV